MTQPKHAWRCLGNQSRTYSTCRDAGLGLRKTTLLLSPGACAVRTCPFFGGNSENTVHGAELQGAFPRAMKKRHRKDQTVKMYADVPRQSKPRAGWRSTQQASSVHTAQRPRNATRTQNLLIASFGGSPVPARWQGLVLSASYASSLVCHSRKTILLSLLPVNATGIHESFRDIRIKGTSSDS